MACRAYTCDNIECRSVDRAGRTWSMNYVSYRWGAVRVRFVAVWRGRRVEICLYKLNRNAMPMRRLTIVSSSRLLGSTYTCPYILSTQTSHSSKSCTRTCIWVALPWARGSQASPAAASAAHQSRCARGGSGRVGLLARPTARQSSRRSEGRHEVMRGESRSGAGMMENETHVLSCAEKNK